MDLDARKILSGLKLLFPLDVITNVKSHAFPPGLNLGLKSFKMPPYSLEWTMVNLKRLLMLIVGLSLVASYACSPQKKKLIPLIRVADILSQEDIHFTPMSQEGRQKMNFQVPDETEEKELVNGKENPWGLIRKWKLGGTEREIIAAPPMTSFEYRGQIQPDSELNFGIGVASLSEGLSTPKVESLEVIFRVILKVKERKKTLFYKRLPLPPPHQRVSFSFHKVNLLTPANEAQIIFQTEGQDGVSSFWIDPMLMSPSRFSPIPVILISIDTLRADHLRCYGYERETSPHMDALAQEGVLFSRVYAPSPWTLPSHVSLLTSLYVYNHQVETENDRLSPAIPTLADILRRNGYYCAAFTGGGFLSTVYGYSRGFDLYRDDLGGVFKQEGAEQVARATLEWLRQNKDWPFFLFIHTYQPHSPYACPLPYKARFLPLQAKWGNLDLIGHLGGKQGIFQPLPPEDRENIIALYDAEILYTDEVLIGELVTALKELNLYRRSLIIITSDHGEEFYEHGSWSHGQDLYNESLLVPLIIKFPETASERIKGKRIEGSVRLIDILPTIVDFLGIKGEDGILSQMDGRTLLPVIQGKENRPREALAQLAADILNSHLPQRTALVYQGKKVIVNQPFKPEAFKFFTYPPPELPPLELYDLIQDPQETRNLAEKETELVRQFVSHLEELFRSARKRDKRKARLTEKLKEQLRALGYIK